jgi:hypothetical protein
MWHKGNSVSVEMADAPDSAASSTNADKNDIRRSAGGNVGNFLRRFATLFLVSVSPKATPIALR